MGITNQCWLTYASTEEDIANSIYLAKSLKANYTRRAIGILIHHETPQHLRALLEMEFSFCRVLPETFMRNELETVQRAETTFGIMSWFFANRIMTSYDKIAFLRPDIIVMKNCDFVFKNEMGIYSGKGLLSFIPSLTVIIPYISNSKFDLVIQTDKNGSMGVKNSFQAICEGLKSFQDVNIVCLELATGSQFTGHLNDIHMININTSGLLRLLDSENPELLSTFDFVNLTILNYIKFLDCKNSQAINHDAGVQDEHLPNSVAIVGMAFRLPGAQNEDELWSLLSEGKEGIVKVPKNRWNSKYSVRHFDNSKETEAGFLTCPVDEIDAKFFSLSLKDVEVMDPQMRLALRVMHESLENAGINSSSLKGTSTGVFGGWWRNDYKEILKDSGCTIGSEFLRSYLGNTLGAVTSRISHFLETTGPSISTESGCSTSMVAVDLACKSLEIEECDLALAFGVNLLLHPFYISESNSILAGNGRCKTFDSQADGFGRAEGCTFLVLKRFPDAIKDNDNILGVIRGSAVVQDGQSLSLGTPTAESEALAMKNALVKSKVNPMDVSFIETHGTGTAVGDPMEIQAIQMAYGGVDRSEKLILGAVKTNLGHTESCSGITGIIKTLLCLKHKKIPPHINFSQLNEQIDLNYIPAALPMKLEDWNAPSSGCKRIAGISSFGITGTNAHLILEEYSKDHNKSDNNNCQVISEHEHFLKLSAKSPESLTLLKTNWIKFLSGVEESELTDICYTANIGRGDFPYRTTAWGKTKQDLISSLNSTKSGGSKSSHFVSSIPKICFLFTGQGSQYPGMAEELYKNFSIFRSNFDLCSSFLLKNFGIDLPKVLWRAKEGETPANENIHRSIYSQTSIFCVEYSLFKLFESWGIVPSSVAGHSLGEFAAAVACGTLQLEDALRLVATRSKAIDSLPTSGMIVLKASLKETLSLLKESGFNSENKDSQWLDIAACNTDDQTVLAGTHDNIQQFIPFLGNNKISYSLLKSTHAFHSRLMDPIESIYREEADKISRNKKYSSTLKCDFFSGMLGTKLTNQDLLLEADYWIKHTRQPVEWIGTCKSIISDKNCDILMEIGPHPILSALFLKNLENMDPSNKTNVKVFPTLRRDLKDTGNILTTLGHLYCSGYSSVKWTNLYCQPFVKPRKVSNLPNYPFNQKSYDFVPSKMVDWQIHPLVGTPLPCPQDNLKLYRGTLDTQEKPYLKDHSLGSLVVFPGAGYMETILVAGYSAHQCLDGQYTPPVGPLTLVDFQIEAPMVLSLNEAKVIQSLVTNPTGDKPKISVYSRLDLDDSTTKWISHASGTVIPFLHLSPEETEYLQESTWEIIQSRCRSGKKICVGENKYKELIKHGYKFGKTFQTLKSCWLNSRDQYEMLFEASVTCQSSAGGYVLHPVMIDAMFQALLLSQTNITPNEDEISLGNYQKLMVPVAVSKFVYHESLTTPECFIHCGKSKLDESIVEMFDSKGVRVATMVGGVLLETTLGSILSAIESQRLTLPKMVEESWKPATSPEDGRLPREIVNLAISSWSQVTSEAEIEEPHYHSFYEAIDRLYFLYCLRALNELGIGMELSKLEQSANNRNVIGAILFSQLLEQLHIPSERASYFKVILQLLERHDFLEMTKLPEESERALIDFQITFKQRLLTKGDLAWEINYLESLQILQDSKEVWAVREMCLNMSGILTGSISPLTVLFPTEENIVGPAESFYMSSQFNEATGVAVSKVIGNVLSPLNDFLDKQSSKKILRILEIGAGTGSFTTEYKKCLPLDNSVVEYTYTDVSPIFLEKGKQVLSDTGITSIFKVLNIEECPLSQGFLPHHYDVIFASYVLHATRNITEAMQNIQLLLKEDGGHVFITELGKPLPSINLLFGALDGFSRYEGKDELRKDFCELPVSAWESVCGKIGLSTIRTRTFYFGHGVILGAYLTAPHKIYRNLTCSHPLKSGQKTLSILFSNSEMISKFFEEKILVSLPDRNVLVIKTNKDEEVTETTPNYFEAGFKSNDLTKLTRIFSQFLGSENSSRNNSGNANSGKFVLDKIFYLPGLEESSHHQITYEECVEPFLSLSKAIVAHSFVGNKHTTKLIVGTCGQRPEVPGGLPSPLKGSYPLASSLWGMTKALQNEVPLISTKCVDVSAHPNGVSNDHLNSIYLESFLDDEENLVAYNELNKRHVLRLENYKSSTPSNKKPLAIPSTSRFCLELPPTKSLNDLKFVQEPDVLHESPFDVNDVEVEVRAYSLNFRDVLTVLKPLKELENIGGVGLDFSGIISKVGAEVTSHRVGDKVFGFKFGDKSLPNFVVLNEGDVLKFPDMRKNHTMSFEEAAAFPAVLATAYSGLIDTAKLKSSDTVLIHTGAGGVGLAAIDVAKQIGSTIVATAGSPRKREYLRNLGLHHVFDSRSTDFSRNIRKALNGSGVDVVLNSLTSTGFKEATLSVCNEGARFVEMSRLDAWTEEEVKKLRPDVYYKCIELSRLSRDELQRIGQAITNYVSKYSFQLPYVVFPAEDIKLALNYLQKAKHIGKVVCRMPVISTPAAASGGIIKWKNNLFSNSSSYMITGGLGGIGIEVCKWMIQSGANYVILVSRSKPNEEMKEVIADFNLNSNVISYQCDIGNLEECTKMFHELFVGDNPQCPPLRGVMHAAGVLSDGSLDSQTWTSFQKVFHGKVDGAWNIHNLSNEFAIPLEHFVMFSSVAAVTGSIGQSNHCAANTYLDALAHHRNSVGLPATSVNWGQWGQVGVAKSMEIVGLRPFTPLQGTSALEIGMRNHSVHFGVFEGEISTLKKIFPSSKMYLEHIKCDYTNGSNTAGNNYKNKNKFRLDEDSFWKQYDALTTGEEKEEKLRSSLRGILKEILSLEENETIDGDASFQDLGMDSLMMIELKNSVQAALGSRLTLSLNALRDSKTVNQLSSKLNELIWGVSQNPPPSRDELRTLIREDSALPEDIQIPSQQNQEMSKMGEIKSVLLTGVTGTFGPYLLKELSKRDHITRIYCLVRPKPKESAEERLHKALSEKDMTSKEILQKIVAVAGDISEGRLGMDEKIYTSLAREVDCVVHSAALMDIQDYYRKSPPTSKDSRTVNVLGTHHILRFCSDGNKLKYLFHTSTYAATNAVNENNLISEDWPSISEFDNYFNSAYPISKFLSELLICTAVERGFPCKVFRFPFMGVDSISGNNINVLQNNLLLRMLTYMYVGCMPAAAFPITVLPVDICAEMSMALFFHEETGYDVYNVLNPHGSDEQEIDDVAEEFGFPVEIIEPDEFIEKVEKLKDSHLGQIAKSAVSRKEDRKIFDEFLPAVYKTWLTNKRVFYSEKVEKLMPGYKDKLISSMEYLRRDLQFAMSSGVFEQVGLVK